MTAIPNGGRTPSLVVYTPASDTCEIPSAYRGPRFFNNETVELHLIDLRPEVAPARRSLRDRLVLLWLRLLSSPFAGDVRESNRAAFWCYVAAGGFLIGATLYVSRGTYVTWNGVESIPAGAQ